MSFGRLVLRSLAHYWRTGIVVAIGLAVATSVIVGSLVIGDSIEGSLRRTALARLGAIFDAITSPRFFRASLSDDSNLQGVAYSLIMLDGSAQPMGGGAVVAQVSVIGVESAFGNLFSGAGIFEVADRQAVINVSLAADAGVGVGDTLLVTVSRPGGAMAGTLFAERRREDTLTTLRVTVARILPDEGPGGFRLDGSAQTPRNVFIDRAWFAEQIGQPGSANTLVLAPEPGPRGYPSRRTDAWGPTPPTQQPQRLAQALTLADYGLSLRRDDEWLVVLSDAITLTEAEVRAVTVAATKWDAAATPTSVYLADRITAAGDPARSIAYAVMASVPAGELPAAPGVAPLDDLRDDELVLNAWAAQDLGAQVGERFTITWRTSTPGGYEEHSAEVTLRAVVPMEGLGADPGLVPDFRGITDAIHIGDWDPPFPIDLSRITDRDEEYWDRYRAAPKAFVGAGLLRRAWQGDVGAAPWITAVRIGPYPGGASEQQEYELRRTILAELRPEDAGMRFLPVREQALAAAQGTSDFAGLFLGMSMFLVLAGAGLAAMLMRLSAERRAAQAGIMLATGFPARAVGRTMAAEGALLAVIGAALGTPLGILYAHAVIAALSTWWRGALGDTPALWVFVQPATIITGAVASLAVGIIATWWGARSLTRRPALDLLHGRRAADTDPTGSRPSVRWMLMATLVMAAGLLMTALSGDVIPARGAFFAIGALLLVAALAGVYVLLQRAVTRPGAAASLVRLALRSAAANRGRSLLLVGLLAAASFVIVTVAANSIDFSHIDVRDRAAGTGGFALVATSSVPLRFDPATAEGRANLGFLPEEQEALAGTEIISLLRSPGEDISCLNIARPTHPRLLGVSNALVARDGFVVRTAEPAPAGNPWRLLGEDVGEEDIPAFGDAAGVQWQLHSGLGRRYPISTPGGEVELRFVGLLSGSIFQSDLLVPAAALRRLYPQVAGPSYLLIDAPDGREQKVADALRAALGEMGLEVRSTREVLNAYIGVQNTYLLMFLALGGLGLVLGTIGLVAVILRSAFERRAEFALMLATGFTPGNLATLLVVENAGLLMVGMVAGTVTALIAVAPHLVSAQASVNWVALGAVLVATLFVGLTACLAGARAAVRGRLIAALRTE